MSCGHRCLSIVLFGFDCRGKSHGLEILARGACSLLCRRVYRMWRRDKTLLDAEELEWVNGGYGAQTGCSGNLNSLAAEHGCYSDCSSLAAHTESFSRKIFELWRMSTGSESCSNTFRSCICEVNSLAWPTLCSSASSVDFSSGVFGRCSGQVSQMITGSWSPARPTPTNAER